MEHESHFVDQSEPRTGAKIVALVVVLAVIAGIGGYLVYGSGLW